MLRKPDNNSVCSRNESLIPCISNECWVFNVSIHTLEMKLDTKILKLYRTFEKTPHDYL